MPFRAILSGPKLATVEVAAGRSMKAQAEADLERCQAEAVEVAKNINECSTSGRLAELSNWSKRLEALKVSADRHREQIAHPFTINPDVLAQQPTGDRIFVLRDQEDAMSSGKHGVKVHKSPAAAGEKIQAGWILSFGPLVGAMDTSTIQMVLGPDTENWLGARVLWGRFVGGALIVEDEDAEYSSRYLSIREQDLWSVEVNGA